jgi:hypothetical protein
MVESIDKTVLLSTSNRVQDKVNPHFSESEIPLEKSVLRKVLSCDWSPFVYDQGYRDGKHFREAHAIALDIDNTSGEQCTVSKFLEMFKEKLFILSTSKSHQKPKVSGGKVYNAADRFHVIFPLASPINDPEEMGRRIKEYIKAYPFFDKSVSGNAQLIFGNPTTEIIINDGEPLELPQVEKKARIESTERTFIPASYGQTSYGPEEDILSTPQNRVKLMNALRICAASGMFESRYDWVKVGLALKAASFTVEDFLSISWPEAAEDAVRQWDSFNPTEVTAGTLLFYARQGAEIDLTSPEAQAEIETMREVVAGWRKNKQEETATLLAQRHKDTKAGPPPSNLMPKEGLIRDIANHILAGSIRPLPELAVAAAASFICALAGRKYQTETNLGLNIYFVGLAESGSGKEHARKVIKNLAYKTKCSHLIGGEDIASGAGLISSLDESPTRLFLLDEFGMMLKSFTSKNSGSHQRDVVTKLMILYSSYGSVYHGTEYANKAERKRRDIESPCCIVYGTSTHSEFYDALNGADGASGNIARMLVINAPKERPKRQRTIIHEPPEDLLLRIHELANLKHSGGDLAQFFPKTVMMLDDVYEAWIELDEAMTERMTGNTANSIYARVAENAAKLALAYAVSVDPVDPIIDEVAFAWGRDLAMWCANTLMEQFNSYVADTEHGKTLKRVLRAIKEEGRQGIDKRTILHKVQDIRSAERDEIIQKLLDSGDIFTKDIEPDGKLIKKVQTRLVHSDFAD